MDQLENLTREQLAQIDSAVCDFESSLTTDQPKSIEAGLASVPEMLRGPLLSELIATDIDRRESKGQRVSPTDYIDRFPESAAQIRKLFGNLSSEDSGKAIAPNDESTIGTQQMSIGDTDSGLFVDPAEKTIGDLPTATAAALPRNFGRYRLE